MRSDVIGNATAADETRISIIGAANRVATVVRNAPDPSAKVPGLEWTLAETSVHLATETREYAQLLAGELDVDEYMRFTSQGRTPTERSAILSARQLEQNPDRDPEHLAMAIESAAELFVAAAASRVPDDRVRVTNGLSFAAEKVTKVILGEYLIHGRDIARAARVPWSISRTDALKVIDGVVSAVPEYVNPDTARDIRVSYELRFRGGSRYRLDFDHGRVGIGGAGEKVDCKISADPVAFLLVGYQRTGQWDQILRGRIMAYGRKPWLGMKFGQLLTAI